MFPSLRSRLLVARAAFAALMVSVAASVAPAQFHFAKFRLPCVAFSAAGAGHTSYGNPDQLSFATTLLDEGSAWNGSAFTAPYNSNYFFRFGFVRDSYYYGGTWDDVELELRVNGVKVASAFAGESDVGDPDAKRMTGACAIALALKAGDVVTAFANSDGGSARHLANYEITGFLLGTAPAFSVSGNGHTSVGNPDLVAFSNETLDSSSSWNGNSFTAPKKGCYYFDLSFVRDSAYNGGTWDDVYLDLLVNGVLIGSAWAGESDSGEVCAKRMTGAYACALELAEGDVIEVQSRSDGGLQRHILKYELTGFRIRAAKPFAATLLAFSVAGTGHTSYGSADQLGLPTTLLSKNATWAGNAFTAPVNGIYYFTTSFVRDSGYQGGTSDDVYAELRVNGVTAGYAWAGESDSTDVSSKRMTGAYGVTLRLQAGDVVTVFANSDGGFQRHLIKSEFTGLLLCIDP
ncbi:MAG: hypothetical protein L6Q99_15150 [Planctomycetes bacterium]|nr:hypothetical protein [Planctomycetota bacterium]